MKMKTEEIVAKKYAAAFLMVFGQELRVDCIAKITNAAEFLTENRRILFFLRLSAIENEIKKRDLDHMCERFDLPKSIRIVIHLLVDHKRGFLLLLVLNAICFLYKERLNIEAFTFTSAPALEEEECRILQEFIARQTGRDIIYTYKVDKTLIAGIRLQSDTHLWEHSIAQQMHRMRLLLIH
jgi:ATP synthase F1 delta subunit